MPQCKLDSCREQAVDGPWRKRYCAFHGGAYLAKRKAAQARHAALADCHACDGKVQASRTAEGEVLCRSCQDEVDEATQALDEHWERMRQWKKANTIHDIKEWFQEWHPEIFEGRRP